MVTLRVRDLRRSEARNVDDQHSVHGGVKANFIDNDSLQELSM
jgi:hypothetical protein